MAPLKSFIKVTLPHTIVMTTAAIFFINSDDSNTLFYSLFSFAIDDCKALRREKFDALDEKEKLIWSILVIIMKT